MFELSKQFRFEAAHTLHRVIDAEPSRRIHGHSYRAEVVIRGRPDPVTGMVLDLGLFERALAGARDGLDHRLLDEVPDLGPATMENLAAWIWRRLAGQLPGLARVIVHRDSTGDICTCFGPDAGSGVAA
ncbi:MAG: 6-carboxytetrahydropterin synthase QueD [Tistrella sp.]|jgi:6-pyruvoyltetrahydropterin/6-carboxytetrahydropterin synthase|uniref:6-carboxy-5,6,7,8-tetrahydropterin synthase n=1 Tax=Tistrella mobilis TaxID=171437 RepID=A0A3B9IP07_9PROT|nr:6-carboxytetrahydropterin synthase [Tistrella sp.]MAD39153.1 6-carboxytetrahydropterin synthase QueD [Tistrella sp.]MBA73769.1 6-carboxytetrahydropterin synthase QueD [Tistrella sp.]HAE48959.1 6-carboxytetrahydropterin synthase QueD [Tistrella mobilis]